MGFSVIERTAETAEADVSARFAGFDAAALENTRRVLDAFREFRVSDSHFVGTTGYGYNDAGRDTLDAVYARVFGAEDALVRIGFVGGTHAISCALRAAAPRDGYLSLVGEPYDTLRGVMPYSHVEPTPEGLPDCEAITAALRREKPPAALIQRSRGYSARAALSVADVGRLVSIVREECPRAAVVVDNCYCEFVETSEPCAAGADLAAGSLIKNPGGGLALTGGYIAGKKELVERAAAALTAPGIGRECGPSLGQNRSLFQGLFLAPHVVAQALKTAVFAARMLELLGFGVSPASGEPRYDIIQALNFGDREKLLRFARGIQRGSPVDSFAVPEPWAMPGYADEVVMAAGTFVQGSSIELSCDGPLREPYTAYLQGGLTYEAGKLGVLTALGELLG